MASIKCPSNVSSITFVTSGVKAPDGAGVVTGLTAAEATALAQVVHKQQGAAKLISTAANGDITISMPVEVTGLTINSVAYTVNGAVTPWGKVLNAAVPAPAASIFLSQNFSLVQG